MSDVILERHGKFQWRECRFCGCMYPYPEIRGCCASAEDAQAKRGDQ